MQPGIDHGNNIANPNQKVDVAAAEIILLDGAGDPFLAVNVNVIIDITRNGANGLDAGAEAPNQWYYIWIIANSTGQVAGLLSLSPDNPTLPAGHPSRPLPGQSKMTGTAIFAR